MYAEPIHSCSQDKPLRYYQENARALALPLIRAGKRVLYVAPTGAGKSRLMAATFELLPKPWLFITHTNTLREQSRKTIPGAEIANVQALIHPGAAGQARRAGLHKVKAFAFDEAHHGPSGDWRQVFALLAHAMCFGGTATPERSDGTPLGDVFDELIPVAKYSELVAGAYLVPCHVAKPQLTRAELRKMKVKPDGVQSYLDLARRPDGSWRAGIYFDTSIADCEDAAKRFNEAGVRAKVVSCEVTGQARQDIFDEYADGELDMLCSPQALAEGFDSPRAKVCVLRRYCGSLSLYLQMVGRVLRPYPGETEALLIDCYDCASIHGKPTKDRRYSLEGQAITDDPDAIDEEPAERAEREAAEKAKEIRMQYDIIRDQLQSSFYDLKGEAKERGLKNGWVFHEYKRKTGLHTPRMQEAAKAHVCHQCRHRCKPGESVMTVAEGYIHTDCWFATLSDQDIDKHCTIEQQRQELLQRVNTRRAQ